MASAFVPTYSLILNEISLYYGIPIFSLGIIGGCLNMIVFLSLKTFRQSSCAFYLLILSVCDLGRLLTIALPFIIRWAFGIDWMVQSVIICKLRACLSTICMLSSLTSLCLAILDQYFATSIHRKWQTWCNIRLAYYLTLIFLILWILHGIPYLIFCNHIIFPSTNQPICQLTNSLFIRYNTYGYFLVLNNIFPLLIIFVGLMAYQNVRTIPYRTIPLVRRELEKQLTGMVLGQLILNFSTSFPYSIQTMLALTIVKSTDIIFRTQMNFASNITLFFSMLAYTMPFYLYLCVSSRFRRQFKHIFSPPLHNIINPT